MCCLCPMRGGALKRTSDGQWVHILCALLMGARFKDPIHKEPINVLTITNPGKIRCVYCKQNQGACLECKKCKNTFHLSCGLAEGSTLTIYYNAENQPKLEVTFFLDFTSHLLNFWPKLCPKQFALKFPGQLDQKKKKKH